MLCHTVCYKKNKLRIESLHVQPQFISGLCADLLEESKDNTDQLCSDPENGDVAWPLQVLAIGYEQLAIMLGAVRPQEHHSRKTAVKQDPFSAAFLLPGVVRDASACKVVWARVKGFAPWPVSASSWQDKHVLGPSQDA